MEPTDAPAEGNGSLMAKILIIDDDVQTAERMAHELKHVGHECAVRHECEGILEAVRKTDLDLLILDVMFPGTSGFEVCRQIRSDSELYTLPILFVSSMNDDAEVLHGLEQGADGFITKPIELLPFLQRVDRLLRSNQDIDFTDSLTGLPDAEGTRKLVQQWISRDEAFGLVYVELLHLKSFTERTSIKGRDKAMRHLARALQHYAETMSLDEYMHGHLGGGHFIAVIPFDQTAKYCTALRDRWQKHMEKFYASEEFPIAYADAQKRGDVLDLSICVTYREAHEHVTAQQILDTLSRMHKMVYLEGEGGVHLDRRG